MGETPLNHWRSVDIALLVLLCRLGPHDEVLLEKILNPKLPTVHLLRVCRVIKMCIKSTKKQYMDEWVQMQIQVKQRMQNKTRILLYS